MEILLFNIVPRRPSRLLVPVLLATDRAHQPTIRPNLHSPRSRIPADNNNNTPHHSDIPLPLCDKLHYRRQ